MPKVRHVERECVIVSDEYGTSDYYDVTTDSSSNSIGTVLMSFLYFPELPKI